MKKIIATLLTLLLIFAFGCSKEKTKEVEKETTTEYVPTKAELTLASMTLEQKVGQLFFVRPEALDFSLDNETLEDSKADGSKTLTEAMSLAYAKYPVGGFVQFAKNIESPEQIVTFNEALHNLGDIEPLICIDEEGGLVARIAKNENFSVEKFENMQTIAENGDSKEAKRVGETIGAYLSQYGFDLDFAPVADVNTNPNNRVIGKRAFGSDPTVAATMVSSVIDGLHSKGIGSCIKHFPGHGDTTTDTHYGYAETNKTWDEIVSCEMIPFKAGIKAKTDMVMVAHIAAPKVTGDSTPATLSYELITNKLRGELGYEGVVITDSMAMGAIAKQYSSGEAAILAIKAGVDIVLMPEDLREAYDAVLNAVKSGDISEKRIDESVLRILNLKYQ